MSTPQSPGFAKTLQLKRLREFTTENNNISVYYFQPYYIAHNKSQIFIALSEDFFSLKYWRRITRESSWSIFGDGAYF